MEASRLMFLDCIKRMTRSAALVAAMIVTAALAIAAPATGANWADERTSGPFVCHADFALGEYEALFAELAQLQLDLSRTLGVAAAREPVEVFLFHTEQTYRRYLEVRLPQVPYRRALFVKGSGPGKIYAYQSKELAVDVRHECTHGLLHSALPMVPLWLDEGLAEYFEVPEDQRAFGNPHLKWVRLDARLGRIPKLAQIEAKREVSEMSSTDYRHAWAWTHFMLHGPPEAREELIKFLADIRANNPPGKLSERLERRLPGVDKRLADHFKNWKR
jgi:hypothetical protein